MSKYELNLPGTYEVKAGGASVTVNLTKLSDELIERLVIHGLRQKVADAAASAKKLSEAEGEDRDKETIAGDLMSKVVTNLENGDWGAERSGGGSGDPLDAWRIKVIRALMAKPANVNVKTQHDAIVNADGSADSAGRREFILSVAAKFADAVDAEAIKMRDASKVAIDLNM